MEEAQVELQEVHSWVSLGSASLEIKRVHRVTAEDDTHVWGLRRTCSPCATYLCTAPGLGSGVTMCTSARRVDVSELILHMLNLKLLCVSCYHTSLSQSIPGTSLEGLRTKNFSPLGPPHHTSHHCLDGWGTFLDFYPSLAGRIIEDRSEKEKKPVGGPRGSSVTRHVTSCHLPIPKERLETTYQTSLQLCFWV